MAAHKPAITIIGAGPAGLFAAEKLSAAGCAVTVYDRKPSPARKFLMAGRGGLNLTHSEGIDTFLTRYGAARDFMEPLIRAFTPSDLRAWCEGLGQETFVGTSGRVFPKAMKASPLLRAWLARLNDQDVQFQFGHIWNGEAMKADATLLALGGASWPGLGSDGSWADILKTKNVPIVPFAPSNNGFVVPWSDYIKDKFAGMPLKNIRLTHNGHSVNGEIMITKVGIEGGAVYALSSRLRENETVVTIDLHPHLDETALAKKLSAPQGRQSTSTYLRKTLNLSPLAIALLHESGQEINPALIKACPLTLHGPFPIDRAISTAGGIALSALDNNMMIKNMPGVFAAGEMLDWEAPTGGYLLQGCFATGLAAAKGILRFLAAG